MLIRLVLVVEVTQRAGERALAHAEPVRQRGEAGRHPSLEAGSAEPVRAIGAGVGCVVRDGRAVVGLSAEPVADGGDGERASDDDDRGTSLSSHADRLSRVCRSGIRTA
jgi:hypothetical protein